MANPVGAVTEGAVNVVKVPVAAIKAHPVVWVVALAIIALVVIRYRTTIIGWFSAAPGGARARSFARA